MNNNELEFARKVSQVLDQGVVRIDSRTVARLHDSRQIALDHQRIIARGLGLAGAGHFATAMLPAYTKTLLAVFALFVGIVFTYYWHAFEQAAENAEIDSALLADDLPPAAFIDMGFQEWLERSSQSSQP